MFKVLRHMDKDFFKEMNQLKDPRHQSYITYSLEVMLLTRIMAYCCHIQSMEEMNDEFNQETVIENISNICGCTLDNLPHGDTINLLFKRFDVGEFRNLQTGIIKRLIKSRRFERYRYGNKYYQLIIDGTQLYCFHDNHIKGSLTKTHSDGSTTYHTQSLTAYLMMGESLMLPVDFEMMENEKENIDKQDCELNAAKRLLKRIKENYPRLNIMLSADALYANQTIMKICEEYEWKYIIRFKKGSIDNLMKEFEEHQKLSLAQKVEYKIIKHGKEKSTSTYIFVNEICYANHKVNIVKQTEVKKGEKHDFIFITNIELDRKNVVEVMLYARKRWKIENKGFYDEKHHGYGLTHAYSYHENAVKCHYALLLLSHMIMQMLEHYMKTQGNPKKIMELGKEIKEALRFAHLNAQDYVEILRPIQIRQEISY